MNLLWREMGGHAIYRPAEMVDHLYEQLTDQFDFDYTFVDELDIVNVEMEFKDDLDLDQHEDAFEQLIREWEHLLQGTTYQSMISWRFRMADGSWKSTPPAPPRKWADVDMDAIFTMLLEQSGGGRTYDDIDDLLQGQGVQQISLQIAIIPDGANDGAGQKRPRQLPAFLEAFPVQTPRRNGVPVQPPPRKKNRIAYGARAPLRVLPRGKLVKDCGTTEAGPGEPVRRDCAARALAYLYWKQHSPYDKTKNPSKAYRIDLGGTSLKAGPTFANYYNNNSPGKAIAKTVLKLLKASQISPNASVNAVDDMVKFTAAQALGANARIHVFRPFTTPDGVEFVERTPTLIHSTPDVRTDVAKDVESARLQNEAAVERGNHESLFNLKQSFEHHPIQHYALWLQDGHYHAIHNEDVHLLYKPSRTYVAFCFRCLKPHSKEAMDACTRRQEEIKELGTLCSNCGTTRCDAVAYSTSVDDAEDQQLLQAAKMQDEEENGRWADPSEDESLLIGGGDHIREINSAQQDAEILGHTYCQSCNITFKTQRCFQLHLEEHRVRKGTSRTLLHTSSMCKTHFKCRYCKTLVTVNSGREKTYHYSRCIKGLSVVERSNLKRCGHCRGRFTTEEEFNEHSCLLKRKGIRALKTKSSYDDNVLYVDFETYVVQDRKDNGYTPTKSAAWKLDKIHRVNHICVQHADGSSKWKFKTIEEFILWLFDKDFHENTGAEDGGAKMTTLIAHNGRAYDWPTFLAAVHRYTNLPYDNVTQGAKIMYLSFTNNPQLHGLDGGTVAAVNLAKPDMYGADGIRLMSQVRFIDSLSFIPRALAAFPKMFGFADDVGEKGWWPHTFNQPENFGYVGPIPPISFYEPESYTEGGFADFWTWYCDQIYLTNEDLNKAVLQHKESVVYLDSRAKSPETQDKLEAFMKHWITERKDEEFPAYVAPWNFEEKLHLYCDQDVTILRRGFEEFRKFNLNLFPDDAKEYDRGLDPARYVSITGLCLDIWLNRWYKPMTLIPFSYELAEWMRGGFHGGRTEAMTLVLNLLAFTRRKNPMLYGPEQRRLSKKAHIKAVDLRSSYPFQCHSRPYPTGEPLIFDGGEAFVKYFAGAPQARLPQWPGNLKEWSSDRICAFLAKATETSVTHGWQHVMDTMILNLLLDDSPDSLAIIELTFEGPEGCHIPVLPANELISETRTRVNPVTGESKTTTNKFTKLVFDLYEHVDQVKTTISLKTARRHGYAYKDVRKVVYWPRDQIVIGMWKEYVDTFYAQKLSAEGWPAGVENAEQRQAYLRKLKRDFPGINLEEKDIRKDAGRYAMAKLMVTSNWGRLVMGSNKANTTIFRVDQIQDYWQLLKDPTIHLHDIHVLDKTTVKVRWSMQEEYAQLAPKTNVTVGIFTTEWGRDRLFDGMVQLHPEQLLYYDTDSLYYLSDSTQKGWGDVKQGSNLGDWSDDLNKVGTPDAKKKCIVDWWAGSSKNYGYTKAPLNGGKKKRWDSANHQLEAKIKGFNLSRGWLDSSSAQNKLSYARCKQRIMDGFTDLTVNRLSVPSQSVEELSVRRFKTAHTYDKQTIMAKQSYRFRYDKRQIATDLCQVDTETGLPCLIRTTPYGFSKRRRADGTVIKTYGELVA